MKKVNSLKVTSFIIATVMVISMICSAAAAQAGIARAGICITCGGNVSGLTTITADKNKEIGSCKEGVHYSATKKIEWRCISCKQPYGSSTVEGHLCEGEGGHYCWGACDCGD